MGLFDKLFGGNKSTGNGQRASVSHGGRLNYNPSGSSEYGFYANCYAKYEDGIVYNCSTMPSVSDIKIGYYEKDTNGNYVVWNMDRDEKVGMIDGDTGEVTLSVMELYNRIKKMRPYVKSPSSMTWKCAKAEKGRLIDLTNGVTIGTYDGDAIGATAAFVCLSYEYVQDGKFNSYYYDWMK